MELAPQLLPREEADVAALLEQQLKHEGVEVLTHHKAVRFAVAGENFQAELESDDSRKTLEFDKVLLALGRRANTIGFGLKELGIETTAQGTIEVNHKLQTCYPNIFAVGDVAGPMQFTHFAAHQAWYATVNALFGAIKSFRADYRVIPAVTYTSPEVARVGLNEKEAKQQGIAYELTQYDLDDLDRAICDGGTQGFVRVLTVPGKDRILGVTIVGNHAGELLAEFVLAMRYKLGLNKILGTIHAYPTLMEANKYAAGQWKQAHKPGWILRLLERYHHWMRNGSQKKAASDLQSE